MTGILEIIGLIICIGLTVVLVLGIAVVVTSHPYPIIRKFKSEKTFFNPETDSLEDFPSLDDDPSIDLSVIVPAYNEEERLPIMLKDCTRHLEAKSREKPNFSYEIIIVDDGSRDQTTQIGHQWAQKLGSDKVRVLTLEKNRGKGGAVRLGMMRGRGERLLFADADGATDFKDLEKLMDKMDDLFDESGSETAIVCGSRAHLEEESIAERSAFRTVLMYGFHACVRAFGCKSIKDTQCGFKLLSRSAARITFNSLHIERWAFDVELLKIAEMTDIALGEVSVKWHEVDGSKLSPVSAAIQMFRDLFVLWARYALGAWRIKPLRKRD